MYHKNHLPFLLFLLSYTDTTLSAQAPEEELNKHEEAHDKPKDYFFLVHKAKEKDQFKGQLYLPDCLEREVAHAVSSLESLSAEEQTSEIKEIVLNPNLTLYVRKSPSESGKDSFRFSFKKSKNNAEPFLLTLFGEAYHTFCSDKRIIKGSRAGIEKYIDNQGVINKLNVGSLLPIHYRFFGHFNIQNEYYKDLAINAIMNAGLADGKIHIFAFVDTEDDNKVYLTKYLEYSYHFQTRVQDIVDYCNDSFRKINIQIDSVGRFYDNKEHIKDKIHIITDVFFNYTHKKDDVERAKKLNMDKQSWAFFSGLAKNEFRFRFLSMEKRFRVATTTTLLFLYCNYIN